MRASVPRTNTVCPPAPCTPLIIVVDNRRQILRGAAASTLTQPPHNTHTLCYWPLLYAAHSSAPAMPEFQHAFAVIINRCTGYLRAFLHDSHRDRFRCARTYFTSRPSSNDQCDMCAADSGAEMLR